MDANTIAMMSMIMGSWITIFGAILWQSYRREGGIKSVSTSVSALETKVATLETKVEAIDDKVTVLDGRLTVLDDKIDALASDVADTRERVARIEGHLMAPGSFTTGGLSPAAPDEPRPEGRSSDPDRRQAG
ncbi:MAG: hypothetical protein F4Z54_04180 [Acidimicrobiaceae bacterium]|nr:hypothetical protein [Acidimicrobiaceae bacterium]MYE57963.1 hypothetical protein [Acidimicrobiaceae bacterium]